MKTKFDELFPNGICFDTAGHGTLMQDRYNELSEESIAYIETATLMHHERYKMLLDVRKGIAEDYWIKDIEELLEKARV